MKNLLILAAISIVSACSLIGEPIAEKVADVVDKYCEEPASARSVYRETVNAELAGEGHAIEVTCSGDLE